MAFVKEDIPKEMIAKYNIENTDVWCVDRERDAIFYYSGGNPRGPETSFVLKWKDQDIKIGSVFHETIIEQTETSIKTEIDWQDTHVTIPKILEPHRQEILGMVVDAFACNNYLGKKVIFDPRMNFEADKGAARCH